MILKRAKKSTTTSSEQQPNEPLLTLNSDYDYDTLLGDLPETLGLSRTTLSQWVEDPDLGESEEVSDVKPDLFALRVPPALRNGQTKDFAIQDTVAHCPSFEQIRSQVLENVRELRVGGGGARGYALSGFIRALALGGLDLSSVRIFTGISVGSALTASMAAGMTPEELTEFTFRLDGKRIKGLTQRSIWGLAANFLESIAHRLSRSEKWYFRGLGWFVGVISAFVRWLARMRSKLSHSSWGACETDGMRETLEYVFQKKLGIKNPTFKALKDRGIDLRVVTTIVCCKERRVWTADEYPDQDVIPVLIASMSIPGAFQPFRDEEGHIHADGGVPNNVPPPDSRIPEASSLLVMFANESELDVMSGNAVHEPVADFLDFGMGVIQAMRCAPVSTRKNELVGFCISSVKTQDFEADYKSRLQAYREGFESGVRFINQAAYKAQLQAINQLGTDEVFALRQEKIRVKSNVKSTPSRVAELHSIDEKPHRLAPQKKVTLYYDNYAQLQQAASRIQMSCSKNTIRKMQARCAQDGQLALEIKVNKGIRL